MPSHRLPDDHIRAAKNVDLVAIVRADTRLQRVSSTGQGEYAGPCPKCGGDDRFHVQAAGRWMCRSCHPQWDDAPAYLMWRDNLTFPEAVRRLTGASASPAVAPATPAGPAPTVRPNPDPIWRAAMNQFVARCEATLWGPQGAHARDWLAQRCLEPNTLQEYEYHLGFNPTDTKVAGRYFAARGIVIPRYDTRGNLTHVNVRRLEPNGPKYQAVTGSGPGLFGINLLLDDTPVFLVEGEFDAMLLFQETRLPAVTAGSASNRLTTDDLAALARCTPIVVCFDNDIAGRDGAHRLNALGARVRVVLPPLGHKDITDAHRAGVSLWWWTNACLKAEEAVAPTTRSVDDLMRDLALHGVTLTVDPYSNDVVADHMGEVTATDCMDIARLRPALLRSLACSSVRQTEADERTRT